MFVSEISRQHLNILPLCGEVFVFMEARHFQLLYWNAFECYVRAKCEHDRCDVRLAGNQCNDKRLKHFTAERRRKVRFIRLHNNILLFALLSRTKEMKEIKTQKSPFYDALVKFAATK